MSEPHHLDAARLAALISNPGAHAELLAHLGTECEVCDAFLAAHAGPGVLDGVVDAALLKLAPLPEESLHEAGFARLGLSGPPPRRRRARWPYAAAAALALAGVVFAVRAPAVGPDLGLKGRGSEAVELQALWQTPDGSLQAIGPGAEVPGRGALLFRVRSPRAGHAMLLVQRGAQPPEVLHTASVPSGLEDFRAAGGALGFSLEGESGPVTVWLVVGDPHTAPSLDSAREALHSGASNALAVGRFELHVKP